MGYKLNLNEPGTVLCKWGCVFLVAVPTLLHILKWLFRFSAGAAEAVGRWARISMLAGVTALIVLVLLVAVELKQDAVLLARYLKRRYKKIALSDGRFECQYCGNRRVQSHERFCSVCGRMLETNDYLENLTWACRSRRLSFSSFVVPVSRRDD